MIFPSFVGSALPVFLAAKTHHGFGWRFGWSLQPALALLAGIVILIRPKLLNYVVAIYLIVVGLIGIFHLSW